VTQNAAFPSGENRCHPSPLATDPPSPNDIYTAEELVQPPALDPAINRLLPHSQLQQLPPSYHPVLPLCKPGNLLIP
jgi:hypothetical protein